MSRVLSTWELSPTCWRAPAPQPARDKTMSTAGTRQQCRGRVLSKRILDSDFRAAAATPPRLQGGNVAESRCRARVGSGFIGLFSRDGKGSRLVKLSAADRAGLAAEI